MKCELRNVTADLDLLDGQHQTARGSASPLLGYRPNLLRSAKGCTNYISEPQLNLIETALASSIRMIQYEVVVNLTPG